MSRSLKPATGQYVVQSGPATKFPSAVVSSKTLAVIGTPSISKDSKPMSKLAPPKSQKLTAVGEPGKHVEYRKRAARPTSSAPLKQDVTKYEYVKRPEGPGLASRPTLPAAPLHAAVEAPRGHSPYPPRALRPSDAYEASQASRQRRSMARSN